MLKYFQVFTICPNIWLTLWQFSAFIHIDYLEENSRAAF